VEEDDRSEAGGLQYTAQQLGSSLGTALIGAIVITGLAAAFTTNDATTPRISQDVQQQISVRLEGDLSFVDTASVEQGAQAADVPPAETAAIVDGYADAQLKALKLGILACGFVCPLAARDARPAYFESITVTANTIAPSTAMQGDRREQRVGAGAQRLRLLAPFAARARRRGSRARRRSRRRRRRSAPPRRPVPAAPTSRIFVAIMRSRSPSEVIAAPCCRRRTNISDREGDAGRGER
jgi:hypothetical protein